MSGGAVAVGLDAAYHSKSGVHYDKKNGVVFVAGTRLNNPGDILADITEVPTSQTRNNPRYKKIQKYVDEGATTLVGHSLGSAVVGQYMADHPDDQHLIAHVFDWPSFHLVQHDKRIRDKTHWGDPISALDFTAQRSFGVPHTYP